MPIITLIPKEKETMPSSRLKLRWFFWFSLLVFLAILSSYAFIFIYKKSLQEKISQAEEQLKNIRTEETFSQIKELTIFNSQLQNLEYLLNNKIYASKTLELVEEITHPRVYWEKIDFQPEKSSLNLGGNAADLYVLANQLASLRINNQIKKADLRGISVNSEDNSVNFNLYMELK